MEQYTPRHGGTRWSIAYGSYESVERFALQKLYEAVQSYFPYVVQVHPVSEYGSPSNEHTILVGTPEDNVLLRELVQGGQLSLPNRPQAFAIACMDSPWHPGYRLVAIVGSDPLGVLYGVQEFIAQVLSTQVAPEKPTALRLREAFDSMPDFALSDYPRIEHRGIWTWGYVIYDYRRFLDNMAGLKMNRLIMWNDCPPLNCHEILDYAHGRGIQVILGFPWGWGSQRLDLAHAADRKRIKEWVLAHYQENYADLDPDGIYFQTLTEHHKTEIEGRSVAAVVCEMVNEIAASLLALDPGLSIHFGLHATSIRDRYRDLEPLDPRITIVWEDAGTLPYTYTPVTKTTIPEVEAPFSTFEQTLVYSKKLARLREGCLFALVPKGWTCLDWQSEFEHHGPFLLGERTPGFVRERLRQRQPRWDQVNRLWLQHYPLAKRFYREMLGCSPAGMSVTALVEDGLLEERIQLSVALLAETIWNPERSDVDLLQRASSPYYRSPR
jgi:hypothetical protein